VTGTFASFVDDNYKTSHRICILAQAVFSGHRAAREMDEMPNDDTPFTIERVKL